jgi:hypothetical protein
MRVAGHLNGGASYISKFKIGASATFAVQGTPAIFDPAATRGLILATTTSAVDAAGLALDTGVYSTTQGAEGTIDVDIRSDLVIEALVSGGAADGTALTLLSNTSASSGGTTITDADVGTNDMDGGTVWRYPGEQADAGEHRMITTHNSATDFVVTVPFSTAIAVGDQFLFVPYDKSGNGAAGEDGCAFLQFTTSITQANGAIAAGTGAEVVVVDLVLRGRRNTTVRFKLRDHVYGTNTISA